jgi:hypothetical protein
MKSLVGFEVSATLSDPFGAYTGHHHAPLVASVSEITPFQELTREYGTAATVVRAFYYALADGNGETAAQYIVPEKRNKFAYSPGAMTKFYGGLIEPLELLGIEPAGPNKYQVRYSFKSSAGVCDGRALVTTVRRGDDNLILGIRSLTGC